MLRTAYVALAACALSVLLSACGSDEDDQLVAGNLTLSVNEDSTVRATPGVGLQGENLSATVESPPTKGDVVFTGGSSLFLTYTPRPNENGIDSFTYRISDGESTSNLGRVVLQISPVNDAPTIQPTLTADEDVSVTATLIVDIDGDTFTSKIVTPPSHGTLTVDASNAGRFTYVPVADFNGADSVELSATYTAPGGTTPTVTGTVAITVRPTIPPAGTAAVTANGTIQYAAAAALLSNTPPGYQVRDAGGAKGTMAIGVGPTSGALYLSRPNGSSPNELYFADGARTFKVNAPLPNGDSIYSITAAKSAPVVFYLTQNRSVFRVDLSQPGVAQQVGRSSNIDQFVIDDSGSKIAYTEASVLKFLDFANPEAIRDLASDARDPYLSGDGNRVYYNGLTHNIYAASGALFVVETAGATPPRQFTPAVAPPDSTGAVTYVSDDGHRVYYSVSFGRGGSQVIGVDPDVPGSDFVIQSGQNR